MTKSAREREAVLNVFAAIMRPLMPVAFEYGISAAEIARVLRGSYIQGLEERLRKQSRPTTDARLAIVAGLPKSDVGSLRDAARAGAPHSLSAAVSPDQVGNLLTVWHTENGFCGAYGLALDLDLAPTPGSPRRSFRELAAIACPGVDQEALLDELVAAGSVEVVHGDTIRCLSRAYLPQEADVKQIEWMGRALANVAASFVHNLLRQAEDPVYFERAVVSDKPISQAGRDKFLSLAGERGQEVLTELDTFLTRLMTSESNDSGRRYGVGVYFFEDSSPGEAKIRPEKPRDEQGDPTSSTIQEIDVLAGLAGHK